MVTLSVETRPERWGRRWGYGPAVGLGAQLALLAALAVEVRLGAAAWFAAIAYAVVTAAALALGLRRSGARALGPANQVTLARAVLVGGVAALVTESLAHPVPLAALVTIAAVALGLDAVDGQVARRTGTTTALGARFDMEVDAFLILVLSVSAARPLGAWVLAIGALRYLFVAAAWVLPWLRAALPPRRSRKVVAAAQGIVLVVVAAGVLPPPAAAGAVAAALAALCWSFGRDTAWLWRNRSPQAVSVSARGRDLVSTGR
ncbi:CDP-alcohol phosphatidyltransferase family protein [Rhizomonospora bruguierae]|uniref:CDP-alcohol phosphatidyltransferase family protein n=1 Tax=Rhizomonospora bruguierae TaxID=1581705 RepID=UPI001BCD0B05|nr:CDP-alcohol phosphatidyltransferase family protein [Micromonospora sp. NBRC 107566]